MNTRTNTPRKTQHIINEPTVPYLQARCTKRDEHNQEPIFTALARMEIHIVWQPQFWKHRVLNTISTHAQFKHGIVYSCHSGDPLT